MKNILLLTIILVVFCSFYSLAQIPRVISYQGVLTDNLGTPKSDSSYSFTFRLYESETGGTAIWTETKNLEVKRGLFYTMLGSQTAFGSSVNFEKPYWLSIQVAGEPEMPQRMPLTSVGYSMNSLKADTARYVANLPPTYFADSARVAGMIPNNSVSSEKIVDGSIDRSDVSVNFKAPDADIADTVRKAPPVFIPDGTITSAKIQDGTIQRVDVAPNFKAPDADIADTVRKVPPLVINDGAITNSKLASDAVTTEKILNGTIQRADVVSTFKAPDADIADTVRKVPPFVINDGAITNLKLASDAVTTEKIFNGTILRTDVTANFKAPYSDTTDYARNVSPSISEQVIVMDNTNYQTVTINSNRYVNLKEKISITSDYTRLQSKERLAIQGGGFTGTGTQTVYFGNYTIISGAHFKDVLLDGNWIEFHNCIFEGTIRLPHEADIYSSQLNNISTSTQYSIGDIVNSQIDNSTLLRVSSIQNSSITNSTIGGYDIYSSQGISRCQNNFMTGTKVTIPQDAIFSNNICRQSKVETGQYTSGLIVISGNVFDNKKAGENEILSIDCSNSSYKNLLIADNTFILQTNDPQAINIFNNFPGIYAIVKISGNSFLKGTKAISYSSNVPMLVSDNLLKSIPLGVSTSGNLIERDNTSF
ncbi:MAG: hypothetical protein HYZ34_00025 [Ignavibacteriae bacterium]|nr:hypothetical protein [Ignavibacteriota bacterium]